MPTYALAPTAGITATTTRKFNVPTLQSQSPNRDLPITSGTKVVSGHVRDLNGVVVSGVPVLLFRQSDNLYIGQTTTDVNGVWSFVRDASDTNTYFAIAFTTISGTPVHGTTNLGLVPS